MRIKDPSQVRRNFAEKGAFTYEQIAAAVPLSTHTVTRLLNQKTVRYDTIKRVSDFLGTSELDIAEVVVES